MNKKRQADAFTPPGIARDDYATGERADVRLETVSDLERPIGPFYALRFRNFRLFFVGQIISVAGTWMQTVAQQWLVWELTHQARWLGIVSGVSALPYVAFSFSGGRLADKCSRRAILVWTQTVSMVLAFILAFLAWRNIVRVQHVVILAGLAAIVNAYNMPAQQAFVTDMVDERRALGNAIRLNSLRFNLARFLGPILAGWTLKHFSVAWCFFLNGLSFIAVIVSLLMMRLPPFKPRLEHLSTREGFGFIRRNVSVLRIILLIGAASLLGWSASTLFPVFATRFGRGVAGFSILTAANGVGAALGGFAAAVIGSRLSRRLLIYGGGLVFSVGLFSLAVAPSFELAVASLVLSGFAMIVFSINSNTKVQEDVPDELRGRVMALYSLVFGGLMPVGGLEIGFLAQHIGRHHAGAALAVGIHATLFGIVTLALLLWSLTDSRQLRQRPAQ